MFKMPTRLLLLCLFAAACSTAKFTEAPKPDEQYEFTPTPPTPGSITIPVNIAISDLVHSINSRLAGPLYEDYSFDDGDNLMLTAQRTQDVEIYLSGQTLQYKVPLSIWLKKRLLIGSVEATGDLTLNFKTTFQLQPDWSLATQTEIVYHEWVRRPFIKTGLGELGIEGIANIFLNRSKRDLASQIDRMMAEQLSLRPMVQQVWSAIQQPTLLSPEYQMWVKTTPTAISMTPLTSDWQSIRTNIAVECLNDVTFGEKPTFRENSQLPNLTLVEEVPDSFNLNFVTDVPFAEAERLAKSKMVGQVFGDGKQQVRVEDLRLWGNRDRVVVNTLLSGAVNGRIYFIGRPVLNALKNQIEVADLDYHFETKNFLHRAASFVLAGVLKNRMAAAMAFPLDQNLTEVKNSAQLTLARYQIRPGAVLSGILNNVRVSGIQVTPSGISVNMTSTGRVRVDVGGW